MIRNYLDVCLDVPWGVETHDRADVEQARKILDRDHYGLEKVKERILEFIAVRQLNPQAKGKFCAWWALPAWERPPSPCRWPRACTGSCPG